MSDFGMTQPAPRGGVKFKHILLLLLFAFVVMRILQRAKIEPDPFPALALSGLGIIFGLQAVINMGVNVSLLPAKGMTLPLISYGGSSLVGVAFSIGMVLAFSRRQADTSAVHPPWQLAKA